ncbi:small non-structural protein [Orthohantavirus puumalaense]|uniref:Non-structural protein NS-S n=2 Tax=Orthohantavirus puumalaense TaxID=3052493 RepID=NSS_PUUMS|nr:nonstructural protein [Orthohantavirus puumalaense]I4EPA3.1 RecName: Full=Non-structural protein NS-S; Short=NSs [Puumala virus sotkamo/v-2969/81]QOC68551.1 small non-structural protein [Orthohantavirus puumalaense]CCH22847.1 small non-structural protein [Orthohantavirus puumalaense]
MNSNLLLPDKNLRMQREQWKWTQMTLIKTHCKPGNKQCQHWRTNSQTTREGWQMLCPGKKWILNLLTRLGLNLMTTSRRDQALGMEMSLM